MNFWQRVHTFSMDMLDHAFANDTTFYVEKHVPEKEVKGSASLMAESAMWWYLYDLSVGYPRASMPNTLDVGDIMARPAQPLSTEYENIMERSPEKVILVSLGSHFDHVPETWLKEFCDAFNSVK